MAAIERKSYKWIDKEIETLDPYKDYSEIFRLSMSYGGNDFMNTLIYALVFPNFIVTEWGSRAVWREDGGKVLKKAGDRVERTETKNAAWWWYGPHNPRTKESVESINKLHAYWARQCPGDFSHNDDYIYTLAFSAVLMHRLRTRLGLSGVSEKVKIASHLVMKEMVPMFYSEGQVPLHGYPDDFDGLLRFCEEFESRGYTSSERGNLCTNALFDFFAFRFFPRGFRWLGRCIVIALSLPTTLESHNIQPINPLLKTIIIWAFGWLFWFQEHVLPDGQVAFYEQHESMPAKEMGQRWQDIRKTDAKYAPWFASRYSSAPQWSGCPYHAALKSVQHNEGDGTKHKGN